MSKRFGYIFVVGFVGLTLLGAVACGDGDDNGPARTLCERDGHCDDDQFCSESGTCLDRASCEEDAECDEGEICRSEGYCAKGCRDATDCDDDQICRDQQCRKPDCEEDSDCESDDEVCSQGRCQPPEPECAGVTRSGVENCDPDAPVAEGYTCADISDLTAEGAHCYINCDPPPSGDNICDDDTKDPCQAGSFCADVGDETSICFSSQCNNPGDIEGCDDVVEANPDEFEHGANCVPFETTNGTYGCEPAGTLEEGDECGEQIDESCGEGLACNVLQDECKPVCNEDDDCNGDDTCVADDTGAFFGGGSYGVCGDGCDAFSRGQCEGDKGCRPISPDDGACGDVGDIPAYGECDGAIQCDTSDDCPDDHTCEDDACEPEEPTDPQCSEGSECIALESAPAGERPDARCLPLCDATPDTQEGRDATCPGGDAASFGRFVNMTEATGPIDLYVDGESVAEQIEPLDDDDQVRTVDFVELPLGEVTVAAVEAGAEDDSDPIATLDTTRSLNEQTTFALVSSVDGGSSLTRELVEIDLQRGEAAPSAQEASVQAAMLASLGESVDVYLADGDGENAELTALATDLDHGDTGAFKDVEPGNYWVRAFAGGDNPEDDQPLHTAQVDVQPGSQITVHLWGFADVSGGYEDLNALGLTYQETDKTSPQGYCYRSSTTTGFCFQRVTGPEAYGQEQCSNDSDVPTVFGDEHVCWPSEKIEVGESCDPSKQNPCEEGAYCRQTGGDEGVCANYCQPDESTNDHLGCPDGEECESIDEEGLDFGRCGIPCEPADYPNDLSSPDCDEPGLEACIPYEIDEEGEPQQAFCQSSGDVEVGESCGDPTEQNCAPGGLCRAEAAIDQCSRAPRAGTLSDVLFGPTGLTGDAEDG
ncbi:MAG: hypothetical protein ACOCV2_08410, partial [Persicimonas sp.]